MPVAKQRREPRQPIAPERPTLSAADLELREQAAEQQARARRLAWIDQRLETLGTLETACLLAVDRTADDDTDLKEPTNAAMLDSWHTLHRASLALAQERYRLIDLPCAKPDENVSKTWLRLLLESGRHSRRRAAAIVADDALRGKAERIDIGRRKELATRLRELRAELKQLEQPRPKNKMFDLRYLRVETINQEIGRIEPILRALDSRRKTKSQRQR